MFTDAEKSLLLGILEDVVYDEEYEIAFPVDDRRLIRSIIRKLGGTYLGYYHRNEQP